MNSPVSMRLRRAVWTAITDRAAPAGDDKDEACANAGLEKVADALK